MGGGGGASNGSRTGVPLGLYKKECCCIKGKVYIGRAFFHSIKEGVQGLSKGQILTGPFKGRVFHAVAI
jgi:hypothetical protein